MRGRRLAKRVLHVVLCAALAVGIVAAVIRLTEPRLIGPTRSVAERMEDTNNLRQIIGPVVDSGRLPIRDGAFDPYQLVAKGQHFRAGYRILWSKRSGTGPTDEEVERGDYTNFPWERYRGDGKLEGAPVPLLWEKTPDDRGKVLVAFSDGTVSYADPR